MMLTTRMFRLCVGVVLCGFASMAMAINISQGQGALLYDAQQAKGPSSPLVVSPGYWKAHITAFNTDASEGKTITRLYPYSGDMEMYCTDPSTCIYSGSKQNVFVYYNPPAFGKTSVAAYRAAFPSALILTIIDGSTKSSLLRALSYTDVGVGAAGVVVHEVCSDPHVDGVFFDLEPFDITVPGQFALYQAIAKQFAGDVCIDDKHPKGRVFGVFLNPNKVAARDWGKVAAALGPNGFVAVSAYDVKDTSPPVPVSIQAYTASITGMLEKMDAASRANEIPYTVVIPAASSFSEFNKFGFYDASNPPSDFRLQKDYTPDGITQLGYVKAVREIILATCKSSFYLGRDYWSWGQYKSPNPSAEQMLLPAIPEGEVVNYLKNY
jgi:hypothetical protein